MAGSAALRCQRPQGSLYCYRKCRRGEVDPDFGALPTSALELADKVFSKLSQMQLRPASGPMWRRGHRAPCVLCRSFPLALSPRMPTLPVGRTAIIRTLIFQGFCRHRRQPFSGRPVSRISRSCPGCASFRPASRRPSTRRPGSTIGSARGFSISRRPCWASHGACATRIIRSAS